MTLMNAHVNAYGIRGVIRNCRNIVDVSTEMAKKAAATGAAIAATVDRMAQSNELFLASVTAMNEGRMDDYRRLKAEWQAIA